MNKPVVWVVGDAMADVEVRSTHFRRTPEDPLAPVLPLPDPTDPLLSITPGGAANVAANLAALWCEVVLVTPLPTRVTDEYCARIHDSLTSVGVAVKFRPADKLTTKVRFVEAGRLVGRADFDVTSPAIYPDRDEPAVLPLAVVLTDYGRGAITQDSARAWVRWAHSRGVVVYADPKDGRQDVWNGTTVDVMCCNWLEATNCRAGIKDVDPADDGWAKSIASSLRAAWGPFKAVVVKRGCHGSVYARKSTIGPEAGVVPVVAPKAVFAVQGAGDTYLAALVAASCRGADLPDACLFASAAAGVAVGKPGTAVVQMSEVVAALKPIVAVPAGVLDRDTAVAVAARLRTFAFRVAFTCGCFQHLTPGHVATLKAAAKEADYLLVAVDSDARVLGLKGEAVVPEASRVAVVSAVAGVGGAFVFDEDLGRLVIALKPAVFAKSGYAADEIDGAEYLSAWGGCLSLLPVIHGEHNSALFARIRGGCG